MSMRDHALAYTRLPWSVFPVNENKEPLFKGGFHIATTDPATIQQWYGDRPGAGIGVPMGPPSGIWALDIDVEKVDPKTGEIIPSGEETLAALIDRYGPLPETLSQRTGGGGRQLLFRWNGERIRNRAKDIGPGLDTRGVREDGSPAGYIVVPPSSHYSGGVYSWLSAPPEFADPVPAPLWLVYLATFNKRERQNLAETCNITGPDDFRGIPPAEWPAHAADLLAMAHPGAPRGSGSRFGFSTGSSSTTGSQERYALRAIDAELAAFSATPPGSQDVEMNNTALRLWGLIKGAAIESREPEIRSAFLAACRGLANAGGRRPWTERDFTKKWERAREVARPRDLSHVGDSNWSDTSDHPSDHSSEKGGSGDDFEAAWNNPDLSLLGNGRRPAPAFPVDLLGSSWGAWAERRAQAASAPVDYVAISLLASVGAALANVRWPVAGAGWSEPPILWAALVGSPSSGKSPSMDAAFDLVRHAEDHMGSGFDQTRRDYETEKLAAKAKRELWETELRAALKNGGAAPHMPAGAEEPEQPARPRIRVADVTTEKLGALAAALPRGLLLVRDELSGWLGTFDRYGGGGADRAFAIEQYGGRSYVIDRMKAAEPLRVRHLSIGVLGGVQPEKLPDIIEAPDDGLASRLLWTWPDATPGFTLSRKSADESEARYSFLRLVGLQMGTDNFGIPEPKRIPLCDGAENQLEAFAAEMKSRAEEASGIFAGSLGKARGHVLRLSLVLEFLWWCAEAPRPEPAVLTEKAVIAAAGLLDGYFTPMAERVYGDASIPVPERAAMTLARHLRKKQLARFNARDLRREIGGRLREASAMDAACEALIEAGLIRPLPSESHGPGRKPKTFVVNPILTAPRQ